MPIYAGSPAGTVVAPPSPAPTSTPLVRTKALPALSPLPRRSILLTGANGDSINVADAASGFHLYGPGVRGLGIPDSDVQRTKGAGGGSRWTQSVPQERIVDLPFWVEAKDVPTFRQRRDRVRAITSDRFGPPTLTVLAADGTSRSAPCHVTSGLDEEHGPGKGDAAMQWFPLTIVCPDERARSDVSFGDSIGVGGGRPWIPFGPPVGPSPSRVFGTFDIVNPGDADTPLVWRITGPGGPATFRSEVDDLGFTFESPMSAGEVITFDTAAGTVTDQLGADRYTELEPGSVLWQLPPGPTSVTVSMDSATAASGVRYDGYPRYRALS